MSSANGGFLLYFQKPDAFSASNQEINFEIEKAFEFNPSIIFESTENTVSINFSYTVARKIEALALINHNIPETAAAKLRYCTDDTYLSFIEKDIPYAARNTYIIDTNTSYYNYFQLYISSSAPIQIGCIRPYSTAFQFPHQFSYSYKKRFHVVKEVDTSDEGLHLETPGEDDDPPASYFEFSLNFYDVDTALYDQYKSLLLPGNKVFIPSFSKTEGYYGIVPTKILDSDIDV
jgi:hypothetical protein